VLFAAVIVSQPVLKISFLPDDVIGSRMQTFPISDEFADRLIARGKIAARANDPASREKA